MYFIIFYLFLLYLHDILIAYNHLSILFSTGREVFIFNNSSRVPLPAVVTAHCTTNCQHDRRLYLIVVVVVVGCWPSLPLNSMGQWDRWSRCQVNQTNEERIPGVLFVWEREPRTGYMCFVVFIVCCPIASLFFKCIFCCCRFSLLMVHQHCHIL